MDLIELLLDLPEPRQLGLQLIPQVVELIFDDGEHIGAGGRRPDGAARSGGTLSALCTALPFRPARAF
jgi:hypothetical protein